MLKFLKHFFLLFLFVEAVPLSTAFSASLRCENLFRETGSYNQIHHILFGATINKVDLERLRVHIEKKLSKADENDRNLTARQAEKIIQMFRKLRSQEILSWKDFFRVTDKVKLQKLYLMEYDIKNLAYKIQHLSEGKFNPEFYLKKQEKLNQWSLYQALNFVRIWANELTLGIGSERFYLPVKEVRRFLSLADQHGVEHALETFNVESKKDIKKHYFLKGLRSLTLVITSALSITVGTQQLIEDIRHRQNPQDALLQQQAAEVKITQSAVATSFDGPVAAYKELLNNPQLQGPAREQVAAEYRDLLKRHSEFLRNQ